MREAAPFERLRLPLKGEPQRIELGGCTAIEVQGTRPRGLALYFVPPLQEDAERWKLDLWKGRVIPCATATEAWLVWPPEGSSDLDPCCHLILWREPYGQVNIGDSVRTFRDTSLFAVLEANRSRTIGTNPAIPYELHEQINGNFSKGTLETEHREFRVWCTASADFRVTVAARDFVGGYRETRFYDSSAMPGGGHGLEIFDACPPFGWKLTAHSTSGASQSTFSFVVATAP